MIEPGLSIVQRIRRMPEAKRKRWYETAIPDERAATNFRHNWEAWARPEQLEPSGDWLAWLLLAGRGFG